MNDPVVFRMAVQQHPQVIVHNTGPDGSLRGAAGKLNIPAITVEIADAQQFQKVGGLSFSLGVAWSFPCLTRPKEHAVLPMRGAGLLQARAQGPAERAFLALPCQHGGPRPVAARPGHVLQVVLGAFGRLGALECDCQFANCGAHLSLWLLVAGCLYEVMDPTFYSCFVS